MAWPIPISRSRDSASPAIVMDRQEKNAEPRTTTRAAPTNFSGSSVSVTPRSAERITTTVAWDDRPDPSGERLAANQGCPRCRGDHQFGQHACVALPDDLDAIEDRDEQRRLRED